MLERTGQIVRFLLPELAENGRVPLGNRAAWNRLFYKLKSQPGGFKPRCVRDLFFEWDGLEPTCPSLEEYLTVLTATGSAEWLSPHYREALISDCTLANWRLEASLLDKHEKAFIKRAANMAREVLSETRQLA